MLDLGSGQMVANPVLVIQGKRIGSLGQATVPKDARIVDLGEVTLLPGSIKPRPDLADREPGSYVSSAFQLAPWSRLSVLDPFVSNPIKKWWPSPREGSTRRIAS